jgi:hypothetical protein
MALFTGVCTDVVVTWTPNFERQSLTNFVMNDGSLSVWARFMVDPICPVGAEGPVGAETAYEGLYTSWISEEELSLGTRKSAL